MEGWRKTAKTTEKSLQSPKTLNASGTCQEVNCINMQTGSMINTITEYTRNVDEVELDEIESV